jgi:two-component system cell cycle sensor histidine kinase/response regulator CckA
MKTLHRQTRRILFADDDQDVREITRVLLENYGHRVTATDCGREAVHVFSINPGYFDLAILDQEMPDLKGTDVASRLVGLRPAMPIVLYTGCLDDDLAEKARKAGIKEIASKPLSIDLLLDLIDRNSKGAPVCRRRTERGVELRLVV